MPELAELKLTADYINRYADKKFIGVSKNPSHKGTLPNVPNEFSITAKSRGKELLLTLHSHQHGSKMIRFNMGMTGYFKWIDLNSQHKHAHLTFNSSNGKLSFIDVRRFGSWCSADGWGKGRGPDPTLEWDFFVSNIYLNLHKNIFKKPIGEVLMNQSFFNGIGNYLRAEILFRADISPFKPAIDAIKEKPIILELCKTLPLQAYRLGGGQLKDWKNPFEEEPIGWDDFMKCYGNPKMAKCKDGTGRTLWYNSKWIDTTCKINN